MGRGARSHLVGALALALSACGGGGSGGGIAAQPGASPTPTATPAPVPTPTPTPVASVRVVGVGTGPAFFIFYADETFQFNNTTVGGYGTRNGEFYANFARAFQTVAYGTFASDLPNRVKSAQVIDAETGTYGRFRAPAEGKVVSPLTSLLLGGPDQAKLKRQLGIVGSLFGLQSTDPDLLTFDPVTEALSAEPSRRADAARLLSANARALALGALLQSAPNDLYIIDTSILGVALAAAPDRFLFSDNAETTAVVARVPGYANLRPDVQSAIAHLVDAYAAAVPLQISDADQAARYLVGVQGYLVPGIRALRRANTAAAATAALAVSSPQIAAAVERYAERIPATTTGFFFPGADHYEMAGNTTLRLPIVPGASTGHPLENDLFANGPTGAIGFFTAGSTITAVSVPASNVTQVSASLGPNSEIIITPAAGFTGLTYVDYTVSHPSGEVRSARIFVRVTPAIATL